MAGYTNEAANVSGPYISTSILSGVINW